MATFKNAVLTRPFQNQKVGLPRGGQRASPSPELVRLKRIKNMQFRVMGRVDKMNAHSQPCSKLELGSLMGTASAVINHKDFLPAEYDIQHGDVISVDGELKSVSGRHVAIIKGIQSIPAHQAKPTALLPKEWVPQCFIPQLRYVIRCWSGIQSDALKQLLVDVFYDPANAMGFMNAQASLKYHHAFQGGLLDHTAEMLHQLSHHPFGKTDGIGRDLCLTLIILHDIGKTVTTVGQGRTDRGNYQPHEMAALELLAEPLSKLARTQPTLANLVRGYFKPSDWYPRKPVKAYRVVSYLDRQSAERLSTVKLSASLTEKM